MNVVENPDGSLTETEEHTGHWAWRHPHTADGSVTYTKLQGDVRMFDVDFAYVEGKTVLFDDFDDEFVEQEEAWTEQIARYIDEHIENFAKIE